MFLFFFLSLSENLSEVSGLGSGLVKKDHIRVLPGKWKWAEDDTFPPLGTILDTHFWKDSVYLPIRETLKQPIPNPEVLVGGEFVTINVCGPQKTPPPNASQAPEPPEDLGTEVIDEGEPNLFPSSSATAPSEPATRREALMAALGVPDFGLIHLVGLQPGSFVPASLKDLPYQLVIIEVTQEDASKGVHQLVARLINATESLLVVLTGDPYNVTDVAAAIQRDVTREQLKQTSIRMYHPSQQSPPFQMDEKSILILSRLHLKFKVYTHLALAVCFSRL